jgi:hypothetical protein
MSGCDRKEAVERSTQAGACRVADELEDVEQRRVSIGVSRQSVIDAFIILPSTQGCGADEDVAGDMAILTATRYQRQQRFNPIHATDRSSIHTS